MKKNKPALFACLLFLSSCLSMSRQEKTEHLSGPVNLDTSVEKGVASSVFSLGDWPKEEWWYVFESAELNRLMCTALEQNPSLQSVQSRLQQAKEEAKIVKAKLFPTLFFEADDNWSYFSYHGLDHLYNPSLPIHGYQIDLSLSFAYEFDFWGKNKNLFLAALGEYRAKEAELALAKLILTTSLAQSYFAYQIQQYKKTLYSQLCDIKKKELKLQEDLLQSALSSKLPLFSLEVEVQEAEQLLLAIEKEIAIERHLINVLSGQTPDHDLLPSYLPELPSSLLTIPTDLSCNLLARRPDLMAQIWRVESLAHQVGAARAEFYPNINLAAFAGLQSTSISNLLHPSSSTFGLAPALNLPIFTAGAIRANIRATKALFDAAVFDYNQKLLDSAQEVVDWLVHVQTIFQQKALQDKAVQEEQDRLSLIFLRQAAGLDTEFAPLFQQEALIKQQLVNYSLLYNQYAFTIRLIKSLGGGYASCVPIRSPS